MNDATLARLKSSVVSLMLIHATVNSGGYIFVKAALSEFEPFAFAFWRFVFGFAGLAVIMVVRKARLKIDREDWPRIIFLALIAVPGNQLLYLNGMRYTVPSHASFLYGSTVVLALILSTILGYEKLRPYKVVAIIMAVLGVALVVSESPTPIIGSESFAGDILVALSVVAWATYTVMAKPIVTKYGPVQATLICLTLGMAIGLPFLIAPAIAQDYTILTWKGWAGPIYTGIMVTSFSYMLWFAMLKTVDPSQVAILTSPQPVIATALSVLLLGETIGLALVLGGLLVVSGVVLMQLPAIVGRKWAIPWMT